MSENPGHEKREQSTADSKSSVEEILRQLTSSAEAVKKHRDDSKLDRARRNLDEAIEDIFKRPDEPKDEKGK
ncbi:uncharacterized protein N7518_005543 [Penicillium psychrosexuale]|uniref:uncharacterized protein n=1 Tax=Penicillium psychrosexuale TaxID=1002107 RepID=UPI002545B88F|nr:uncharacterized protein N7518_005543 [Penicillium psychrosexuale]KAJ5797003.1 hypothetical protein N7518_005543 [Penicillium psychrosexuale]